jgi:hypothetical protein
MNGPEHYREAERLMTGDDMEIAQAQVHATLALAAATVESALSEWFESEDSVKVWAEATRPAVTS